MIFWINLVNCNFANKNLVDLAKILVILIYSSFSLTILSLNSIERKHRYFAIFYPTYLQQSQFKDIHPRSRHRRVALPVIAIDSWPSARIYLKSVAASQNVSWEGRACDTLAYGEERETDLQFRGNVQQTVENSFPQLTARDTARLCKEIFCERFFCHFCLRSNSRRHPSLRAAHVVASWVAARVQFISCCN